MAGLRQLLDASPGNRIVRVSAFTNQIRGYLPPVDTADALFRLESGVTGTFQLSVGTSLREDSWTVACEGGWIKVEDSKVTISRNGQETVKTVPNERTGVPPEVREWGSALAAGKVIKGLEPEPALADLELVSADQPFDQSDALTLLDRVDSKKWSSRWRLSGLCSSESLGQ